MSYSFRKLRFFVDDTDGSLRQNTEIAEQFCLAEDDNEIKEFVSLMDRYVHFGSLWGMARGTDAARAVMGNEQEKLRITWTSRIEPMTAHTFMREGYVHILEGTFLSGLPFFGMYASSLFQKQVRESLVVRNGKVVFRDFGYRWDFESI